MQTTDITLSWCPGCREWSCGEPGASCAWCDTTLVKRRGGWKRPDRYRFTRKNMETIYVLHSQGVSLREISRQIYERCGYASASSCLETIRTELRLYGFGVRDQGAATAASNAARRKRLPDEDKNAYKRRMRREKGYRDSRTGEWKHAQAA